jgi:acyl transferase domain-containing protein
MVLHRYIDTIQVKANVGHSEGASGITSLIKVILSLQHEMIPPNIKFNTPNPKSKQNDTLKQPYLNPPVAFRENRLIVPTKATPWPQDRCKRASVNSFGIGGTNAHVGVIANMSSHQLKPMSSLTPS